MSVSYHWLLYIELTISFLIGRKCTVNFWNQYMWRHNCRLYNNHVKVTGNHVVYDRGAWFLRVIMSSSLALFCLPSEKKQKHEFFFCFVQCIINIKCGTLPSIDKIFVAVLNLSKGLANSCHVFLEMIYIVSPHTACGKPVKIMTNQKHAIAVVM